jgi:hypothetical protein
MRTERYPDLAYEENPPKYKQPPTHECRRCKNKKPKVDSTPKCGICGQIMTWIKGV